MLADDMAAATKSSFQSSKSGSRGDRDSGSSSSILKRGKPATTTSYNDHKVPKMSRGSGRDKRLCYQCKSPDHLSKAFSRTGSG